MMSTFSGLVVGVVTAAAVTVLYGDALQRKVRDMVRTELPFVERHIVAPPTRALAASDAEASENVAATPTQVDAPEQPVALPAAASPRRDMPKNVRTDDTADGPTLEQRWAQYAAGAAASAPAGDFPHRECFTRAAAATGMPEALLLAVARGESNFDSAARSDKDAVGLMQIRWPGTSRHLGIRREADLYDPCTNVDAGARYLAELSGRFDGDLHRVMGAYNYGPGRIGAGPMPKGAQWYSQYIYQHLQRVLGRPHVASSALLAQRPGNGGGYQVLMTFNRDYRAREFMHYLRAQAPGVELAQRSERLGLHEVVLLYDSVEERRLGLQELGATGLVALDAGSNTVNTL
jgi:soluble lytic murein transglycosylase-like protein